MQRGSCDFSMDLFQEGRVSGWGDLLRGHMLK